MNLLEKMGAENIFNIDFTANYQSTPVEVFRVGNYLIVFRLHRNSSSESPAHVYEIYNMETRELKSKGYFSYDSAYFVGSDWKSYYYSEDETYWYIYSVVGGGGGNESGGRMWEFAINKDTLALGRTSKLIEHSGTSPRVPRPYFYDDKIYGFKASYSTIYPRYQNILNFNSYVSVSNEPANHKISTETLISDNYSELPNFITTDRLSETSRKFFIKSFDVHTKLLLEGVFPKRLSSISGYFSVNGSKYVIGNEAGESLSKVYAIKENGSVTLVDEKVLPIFHFVYGDYLIGESAIYNVISNELIVSDEGINRHEIINIDRENELVFSVEHVTNRGHTRLKVYSLSSSSQKISIKHNDSWLNAKELLVKTNESWKKVSGMYTKINGVWR